MTKKEKQGAIIVGLSLLAIGTGFAFFSKKKEECGVGEMLDEEGNCVPIPLIPADPVTPPGPAPTPDPVPGDIDDLILPYPDALHFYQVKVGDWPGYGTSGTSFGSNYNKGLSVSGWLIRREMFHAAMEFGGLSKEAAMVWVNSQLGGNKLLNPSARTLDIILCSAFNDACYSTWGYCGTPAIQAGKCPASMRNRAGSNGRAIRLLKQHPDNIARIRAGQVVARYVTIGSPANAGDASSKNVSGKAGKYPALWMPKLDRKLLWDSANASGGVPQNIGIETSNETWDDGSPLSSPPPWITRGGEILDFSGTLSLPGSFGCAGNDMTFRPGG